MRPTRNNRYMIDFIDDPCIPYKSIKYTSNKPEICYCMYSNSVFCSVVFLLNCGHKHHIQEEVFSFMCVCEGEGSFKIYL